MLPTEKGVRKMKERISKEQRDEMFAEAIAWDQNMKSLAVILGVTEDVVRHWRKDYTPTVDDYKRWKAHVEVWEKKFGGRPVTNTTKTKDTPKIKEQNGNVISFVPNKQDEDDLNWFMRYDGETNRSEIMRQALRFYIKARIDRLHELERGVE